MKSVFKIVSTIVPLVVTAVVVLVSCVTAEPVSFMREKDFYYGEGSGATVAEAEIAAKTDLVASAMQVSVTPEMAAAFPLKSLRPFISEKNAGAVYIVYRYSVEDWTKREEPRERALREELTAAFGLIEAKGYQDVKSSLEQAAALLNKLSSEGLSQVLTVTETDSTLFSRKITLWTRELVASIHIELQPAGSIVQDDSVLSVSFRSSNGKPVVSLPVAINWVAVSGEIVPEIKTTDSSGKISLLFPENPALKNKSLTLKLVSAFGTETQTAGRIRDAANITLAEFALYHFDDAAAYFSDEIKITGGSFTAGAVSGDRRAEAREKPRAVTLADFYIDRYPVTNGQYRVYLDDMKVPAEERAEFWDNQNFNGFDQPVIGISIKEVNDYIAWLNSRFGIKKRLPTEDEWERAAHGGVEAIYPWGNQDPKDGPRANFNGNGRFDGTSPVGSFETGKNAFGLYDMAGNVSEWTSTAAPEDDQIDGTALIVKGGSWMDGPAELRVSARRYLNSAQRYGDVGFRLVREISNE